MAKHYIEKHLLATTYKIENVKKHQNFLGRNWWKVILAGIVFSFWAPTYSSHSTMPVNKDSMYKRSGMDYPDLVILCATIYIIFCLAFHFSTKYQDKKRLKELYTLKQELEEKLNNYEEAY